MDHKNKNMKNYKIALLGLVGAICIFAGAQSAEAGSAVLTWNANTESDLQGYKVYYDTSSHAGTCPTGYAQTVTVQSGANTGHWFDNLTPGQTYYFQVTAIDTSAKESGCSTNLGEVSKLVTYRGDINNNHNVDINDFTLFATNYGRTSFCGTATTNRADITRDCNVNINDFTLLAGEYGLSF